MIRYNILSDIPVRFHGFVFFGENYYNKIGIKRGDRKMRRTFITGLVLVILVVTVVPAFAWYRHGHHPRSHFHFGLIIGPPIVFAPPPPVVRYYYYRPCPPPDYYEEYYYEERDRVWVPGHWEYRETPYGWRRVWIPGHWEWRVDP